MQVASHPEPGREKSSGLRPAPSRVGELIFAGLAFALGVAALVGSFGIRAPESSRVGPTVFPVMVSIILMVAAGAVFLGVLRGRVGAPEGGEDVDLTRNTDWIAIGKIVAIIVAHLVLIGVIGWAFAAALLFSGTALALGAKRWWPPVLIGLAIGLAIQVVFGELLGLSLPPGPALGWLHDLI